MKFLLFLIVCVCAAAAYPTQEGAAYTNEAIRQAQTSRLIPQNAQIQNVGNIHLWKKENTDLLQTPKLWMSIDYQKLIQNIEMHK